MLIKKTRKNNRGKIFKEKRIFWIAKMRKKLNKNSKKRIFSNYKKCSKNLQITTQ